MSDSDRRFSFDRAHKLDDPARMARQPAPTLVAALELEPDSSVLDIGAGTGYFALPIARALADAGGQGRVIAVDVEPRMLEVLARRATEVGLEDRIVTLAASGDTPAAWPPEARGADRALLANLYHELPEPSAYLAALATLLAPGGLVLVVDWDPDGTLEAGPPRAHRVPAQTVAAGLAAAGFIEITRLSLFPDFHTHRARVR